MSDPVVIGFVCEGNTDIVVLRAVIDKVLGHDYQPRRIRPDLNGGAWRSGVGEVQRWCERLGPELEWYLAGHGIDALIIHVDADVRRVFKVSTTEELCDTVKGWLGAGSKLPNLVIVIPKEATEAWLLAAIGSATPQIENEKHPRKVLIKRGAIPKPGGPSRAKEEQYEELARQLAAQLLALCEVLPELKRFVGKLRGLRLRRELPADSVP